MPSVRQMIADVERYKREQRWVGTGPGQILVGQPNAVRFLAFDCDLDAARRLAWAAGVEVCRLRDGMYAALEHDDWSFSHLGSPWDLREP